MSFYDKNQKALGERIERGQAQIKLEQKGRDPFEILKDWFEEQVQSLDERDEKWESVLSSINAEQDVKRGSFCHDLLSVGFPIKSEPGSMGRKYCGPADLPKVTTDDVIKFIKAYKSVFYHRFPQDHPTLKNCSVYLNIRQDVNNIALMFMPFAWQDIGYRLIFNTNDPEPIVSGCIVM